MLTSNPVHCMRDCNRSVSDKIVVICDGINLSHIEAVVYCKKCNLLVHVHLLFA